MDRSLSTSHHEVTPNLKIWSCVTCRRRKIRCDRKEPCNNCTKNKIDCHFPVTGRIPRRTRDAKTPAQKQSELLSRLRRLESVVTELAAQVEDENGAKTMGQITVDKEPTESSWATSSGSLDHQTSEFDEDFGRLVVDKDGGLHVGNRFWTVFCSEVDNILQAVHDVADISETPSNSIMTEPTSNGTPAPLSHLGFVFGSAEFAKALDGLNPMPSQMLFIWQTYVENVDPFIKVLHTPAIENIVKQLKGNFSSCGHNVEALLFAICLAAIASMDEKTVSFNFNTPREQLLQRYQFGTEQALARANFLTTKDITILQALVIYLSLLPNIGAQDKVWPLTGLLLRLAKSVCLHREGDPHQYNQLEREIRRRLWWHICFIDSSSRRADAQDLSITPASFSTGLPTNSNDVDLDSSTTQIPNPNQGSTGVTLCLIRCELWYLTQAIRADTTDSLETRLGLLNALRQKVEKTYFQHLQPNQPWDSFIRTMTTLFFAKVELVIRRRSKTLPAADELLTPSITVTKAVQSLKSEPAWVKWRWQLQGQMPWHAMGVYLRQASRLPWTRELEEAWGATTALKEGVTEEMKTGSLWRSLMQLFSEAEQHREMELKRQGANAQHTRDKGDRVNSDVQQMLNNAENMSNEIPVNHPLIDTSTFDSSLHISPPADNGALSVERLSTSLGTAADDLPSWVEAGGDMNFGQGQNFGNSSSDGTADGVDWEALMDLDETWNWDFL
ncbi:Bikaverin cluster transcription factor bik5 [Fusarium oxysporum f. sp. cubense]|uniref:Bikaverin cluster transcription factor bik5 n=1 Tax=Fusarium oxysporum f. sp. cubense TaxID=61366 RepID=A0A559KZW8_FUSOC|nr:Bikaverin cluster transcription factor bik5 [Fusarium oxysporum f. sp. cubense]